MAGRVISILKKVSSPCKLDSMVCHTASVPSFAHPDFPFRKSSAVRIIIGSGTQSSRVENFRHSSGELFLITIGLITPTIPQSDHSDSEGREKVVSFFSQETFVTPDAQSSVRDEERGKAD
jgi:hypothetical protein